MLEVFLCRVRRLMTNQRHSRKVIVRSVDGNEIEGVCYCLALDV